MIVQWAPWAYVATLLVVVFCLWRGHRSGKIDLWDCIRAGRDDKVFTDPRKLFEAGAFTVMTVTFCYLSVLDKMSEAYAALYVGAWVVARSMRDREQRLSNPQNGAPSK